VIDALTIAKQQRLNIVVAVSGSPEDSREPGYFGDLMKQVEVRGLEESFRYLGMIPLDHVYALLRASIALINPSRFEGWSTTVEEAKSFGVPTILSDIEVHREQTGGTARYFGVDDPQMLATHLGDVSQAAGPPVVRDLLPDLDARVASFAVDVARVIQSTIRLSRR